MGRMEYTSIYIYIYTYIYIYINIKIYIYVYIYKYKDALYLDKKFYNAGVELKQADICRDFHTKSLLRITE